MLTRLGGVFNRGAFNTDRGGTKTRSSFFLFFPLLLFGDFVLLSTGGTPKGMGPPNGSSPPSGTPSGSSPTGNS